jgi:hypothetical protein
MDRKPSPGHAAFAAVALFLAAWHVAPRPEGDPIRWLVVVPLAVCGLVLMLQAITHPERRPCPWPGTAARIAWGLRPRGWMIAWTAIFAGANAFGTPHVLIAYPPRTAGECVYIGMWGAKRAPVKGGGFNGCRLATLL